MHLIKNILFIFSLLLLQACIKSYNPEIESDAENKFVVSGRITDVEGWQQVEVSTSSHIGSPRYLPLADCSVKIQDDKGNDFAMVQTEPGIYKVWMEQVDLQPGTSYKVQVVTPGNVKLESGFDMMPKGPKLDSIYYSIVDVPTSNPAVTNKVMQFYVDLNAIGDYSHYYKWDIEETWEYHARLPAQYYYNGVMNEIHPPDYSNNVCYTTGMVKNVFTLSTQSLSQNQYKKFSLHNIDGQTSRLAYQYSMLVSQLALSEGAYNYWEQLRINSNEQGGLYEKQPLAIKGNMVNLTNPSLTVLGYFYAASVSSRRYFYKDVEGIELDFYNGCAETPLGKFGWREYDKWEYPIYFYYNTVGALRVLNIECVDCRKMGGTTVKPEFWPN